MADLNEISSYYGGSMRSSQYGGGSLRSSLRSAQAPSTKTPSYKGSEAAEAAYKESDVAVAAATVDVEMARADEAGQAGKVGLSAPHPQPSDESLAGQVSDSRPHGAYLTRPSADQRAEQDGEARSWWAAIGHRLQRGVGCMVSRSAHPPRAKRPACR